MPQQITSTRRAPIAPVLQPAASPPLALPAVFLT